MLISRPREIEEVKRLNMVDFLSRHYGLDFSKEGAAGMSGSHYCCLSPFKEERNPSFFVREVDGRWLFKDFSSGHGGSLIDFILLKEGFGEVSEALNYINDHLCDAPGGVNGEQSSSPLPVYDFGDSKDANEYLQKRKQRQKVKRLSAEDKLSLHREFQRSGNKSEVALEWGINRSYMYEVVKECEALILSGFSRRRPGRKPAGQPDNLEEACNRLKHLEAENRRLDEERERYWVRNEFTKLRLKHVEEEADELRDEMESNPNPSTSSDSKNRKKHLKKKRRKKS